MKVRSQNGLFSTVIGTIKDVITHESEIEKNEKRLCADPIERIVYQKKES